MYDYTMNDSDSDEETQILDIMKLNAVLETDKELNSCVSSHGTVSISAASTVNSLPSINSHKISRIDSAIRLNKLTYEKYNKLEEILVNRLHECRQKLKEINDTVGAVSKENKYDNFSYGICGKPYFKDNSYFPAPDNEDTIIMAKSQMYDFSHITSIPGWTVKDKSEFLSIIHKVSKDIKKEKLKSKVKHLQRQSKSKDGKNNNSNHDIEKTISGLRKEIKFVNKAALKDIALPLDQEYDWDLISNQLNRRHSSQEYQSLWKLFLHPSINKNIWSKDEHLSLQNIANKYKLQDWDIIAKELNTGRSAYQCFVYFRTNISNSLYVQKWTEEEEEYLKRLVEYYREHDYIPWGKVAASMGNRTKVQIYNKYSRLVELRKGRFLPEEDAVILTFVDKFGKNYRKMTKFLPGRSALQLRTRYNVLQTQRISAVWTVEEDKLLIQLMAEQDTSTDFSSISKHFPSKDRVTLRTRYNTLVKWMKEFPNTDIEKAPRRRARRLGRGLASDNLNKAIEGLKTRFEIEVESKKPKEITKDSQPDVIENAIVAALLKEHVKEQENLNNENCNDQAVFLGHVAPKPLNAINLKKILIMLKAKLVKQLLHKSSHRDEYSDLLEADTEVTVVKIKSYSRRKNTTETVCIDGAPDIWGKTTLQHLEYVLPPHYATIIACKKLMEYAYSLSYEESKKNINVMMKKNNLLKEQIVKFMDRFHTLFLWPILLSNGSPDTSAVEAEEECYIPTGVNLIIERARGIQSGIAIPSICENVINDNIDLNEMSQKDTITMKHINIGNEVFYLDDEKKIFYNQV